MKQPLPAPGPFPQGEFLLGWGILGPFNFYAGEEYGRTRTRGRCHASMQGLTWGGVFELAQCVSRGARPARALGIFLPGQLGYKNYFLRGFL